MSSRSNQRSNENDQRNNQNNQRNDENDQRDDTRLILEEMENNPENRGIELEENFNEGMQVLGNEEGIEQFIFQLNNDNNTIAFDEHIDDEYKFIYSETNNINQLIIYPLSLESETNINNATNDLPNWPDSIDHNTYRLNISDQKKLVCMIKKYLRTQKNFEIFENNIMSCCQEIYLKSQLLNNNCDFKLISNYLMLKVNRSPFSNSNFIESPLLKGCDSNRIFEDSHNFIDFVKYFSENEDNSSDIRTQADFISWVKNERRRKNNIFQLEFENKIRPTLEYFLSLIKPADFNEPLTNEEIWDIIENFEKKVDTCFLFTEKVNIKYKKFDCN